MWERGLPGIVVYWEKQNKIALIRLRMSPFTISVFRANEMTVTWETAPLCQARLTDSMLLSPSHCSAEIWAWRLPILRRNVKFIDTKVEYCCYWGSILKSVANLTCGCTFFVLKVISVS